MTMSLQQDPHFWHFSPDKVFLPYPERFKSGVEVLIDASSGLITEVFDSTQRDAVLKSLDLQSKIVNTISGGLLLPGLTDAHMHPLFYSMLNSLEPISLKGLNKPEVLNTFKQATVDNPDLQKSLLFLDLDSSSVSGIDAKLLDEIFGNRNVCVYDASFHSGIVTTPVISAIRHATQDQTIPGFLKDDGNFAEAYGFEVFSILCADNQNQLYETIEKSLWHTFSTGTTTIHDLLAFSLDSLKIILEVRKNWREKYKFDFPIRRFYLRHKVVLELSEVWLEWREQGLVTESWWYLFGTKLFADGSFGSRTAHVIEQYTDCQTCGLIFDTDEDIKDAMFYAEDAAFHSIALHAIGDQGIKRILEILEDPFDDKYAGRPSLIFRIEHFELPSKEMIETAKKYNVHVVPQPNFLLDLKYKDRLAKRVNAICPLSDISDAEVPMMFGTDGMPESMLYAIYLSTHARESSQRLALEQALHYSCESAAIFEGDRKGTIEVGQKADLILADHSLLDDLKPGPADIPLEWSAVQSKVDHLHGKIRMVLKSGQKVYDSQLCRQANCGAEN